MRYYTRLSDFLQETDLSTEFTIFPLAEHGDRIRCKLVPTYLRVVCDEKNVSTMIEIHRASFDRKNKIVTMNIGAPCAWYMSPHAQVYPIDKNTQMPSNEHELRICSGFLEELSAVGEDELWHSARTVAVDDGDVAQTEADLNFSELKRIPTCRPHPKYTWFPSLTLAACGSGFRRLEKSSFVADDDTYTVINGKHDFYLKKRDRDALIDSLPEIEEETEHKCCQRCQNDLDSSACRVIDEIWCDFCASASIMASLISVYRALRPTLLLDTRSEKEILQIYRSERAASAVHKYLAFAYAKVRLNNGIVNPATVNPVILNIPQEGIVLHKCGVADTPIPCGALRVEQRFFVKDHKEFRRRKPCDATDKSIGLDIWRDADSDVGAYPILVDGLNQYTLVHN